MKRIVCAGACWELDCGCNERDQKKVKDVKDYPPFHDGCTCYVVDEK